MSDIIVDSLYKAYPSDTGNKEILNGFSCVFPQSSVSFITGPSGCGKTTLLRIIAGLEKADSGTVTRVSERISYVFQENRLCEDFSAERNVRIVCGNSVSTEEIDAGLKELGLSDSLRKPVRTLSGGMKRRVAIARAMMYASDLLIMDEPFKGLDAATKETVMEYVKRNIRNRTVICVTHDLSECDYFDGNIITMS